MPHRIAPTVKKYLDILAQPAFFPQKHDLSIETRQTAVFEVGKYPTHEDAIAPKEPRIMVVGTLPASRGPSSRKLQPAMVQTSSHTSFPTVHA